MQCELHSGVQTVTAIALRKSENISSCVGVVVLDIVKRHLSRRHLSVLICLCQLILDGVHLCIHFALSQKMNLHLQHKNYITNSRTI